ncbi:MAG: TatD family hydrolase [Muribaculaceae bacterium]|nr:TatD family hydrolase [Muribaculaceae bacterium]
MIDTHTHLYLPKFGDDKCAAIDRALAAGVELMVLPGVDADSIGPMRELHSLRPEATAICCGLHPTEIKPESWRDHCERVEAELTAHAADYVAVGEIGLDLYWDKSQLGLQLEAVEAQLDLADRLGLPAVIHCRDAMARMLDVMDARAGRLPHMVFHCYSGTADDVAALRRRQAEVMFGIGGVLTFKNSPLPDIVPLMGLDHILLETDAPWLAPVPRRGKRNESAYIPYVADRLADIFGVSPAEVDARTTRAALNFFRL